MAVGKQIFLGDALLDPVAERWTRVPAMPGGPRLAAAVAAGQDAALIWGGSRHRDPQTNLATGFLLRP